MRSSLLHEEGVLRLDTEITRESVRPLIDAILEQNLEGAHDCLRLYINSPGGDVDQGFALIDLMHWSRIPIRTTAMGLVASMGLLVLMAGAPGSRVIMPSCSVLSHRFATITGGSHADLLAARRQQDLVHRRILDHYRTCTLHDDLAIERELLPTTDRWLSPAEAVAYGLADRVWTGPTSGEAS